MAHRALAENLSGDDSRVIMDRAIPFIERAATRDQPFLAVIWLHAPHLPVVASPERTERFGDLPFKERHFLACLEAVDAGVKALRSLGMEITATPSRAQVLAELLKARVRTAFRSVDDVSESEFSDDRLIALIRNHGSAEGL